MALYYHAGFDVAQIGPLSVVIGGTVGTGTATLTTGTHAHTALATVTGTGTYTSFGAAVQTRLNATVGSGWSVTYSTTTHRYTVSRATAFTLTWTGAAGEKLRKMLGFAGTTINATSAIGTLTPWFAIVPTIGGRSAFTDVYEPDDLVEEATADDDTPFAVSRERGADAYGLGDQVMWSDWSQMMEPIASTLIRASSTEWTWERFYKHCRGEHPFFVFDTATGSTVHRLRAQGASFNATVRERVVADWDELWSLRFYTRQMGRL